VIENPGPFSEVSNTSEYIFVGLMSHFVSGARQGFVFKFMASDTDLVGLKSLE
jgi:hypothetical protein